MWHIRPIFIYLLAAVVILYAVLSGGQAIGRIDYARQTMTGASSTDHLAEAPKQSLWQAEAFLRETMAAAQKSHVTWVKLETTGQDVTRTLWVKGKESELLDFYQWFEKHGRISAIKEMELDQDESEAAILQITFAW